MVYFAHIHITLILILLIGCASLENDFSNEISDVTVSVLSNKTSKLSPSEFSQVNFTITKKNNTQIVKNVSISVRLPSQEFYLVNGNLLEDGVHNQSSRLTFNETHLDLLLDEIDVGITKLLIIIVKASSTLDSNRIIALSYTLKYQLLVGNNSSYRRYSYSKIFQTYTKPPFLKTSMYFLPSVVQGRDKINATITAINKDIVSTAYDIKIKLHTPSININMTNCRANHSLSNITYAEEIDTVLINVTRLEPNTVLVCFVMGIVKRNIKPGEKLANGVTLQYYHKPKMPDLYPVTDSFMKSVDAMKIHGQVISSLNASRLMAGDIFNMTVSLNIPNSISPLLLRILLPVLKTSTRKRRSTSALSTSDLIQFVQLAQNSNITYQTGLAIKVLQSPRLHRIDNTTIVIDFGVISSSGDGRKLMNSSSISFTILLQVANNPLYLSGRGSEIIVNFGSTNSSLPIFITGPIMKPLLTIQKYVQIVDSTKASPIIKFTVVIKHENISMVNAAKITITDVTQNIVLFSRLVSPKGTVTVSSSYLKGGYLISAFVDLLPISETTTLVYQGAFAKGAQLKQAKWKASVTWKSPQANSPLFGPIDSQESCISAVSKIIQKTEKSYTMIALGVVLGLILGALTALLVLFCIRKTRVAKTYVFLDLLQTQEDEERAEMIKLNKEEPSRLFSFKNTLLNRQPKQTQNGQTFTADGDNWALMAAARYKSDVVENARYRTLLEELLRAHEASFLFFIDGISQIVALLSTKLKFRGDISAETERKVQQAANGILLNYQKICKPLEHRTIASSTSLKNLCHEYMSEECKLMQNSKIQANKLFESVLPKNLSEDTEKELKSDYEELNRNVLNNAYKIREQMFVSIRDADITRFGEMKVLTWSAEIFTLWSTWLSKKLLREIDIILRKRMIKEAEANLLREKINTELKQGEASFKDDIMQRLSLLQRNKPAQKDNVSHIIDDKLRDDLRILEESGMNQAAKSFKDSLSYITQRWQLFSTKLNEWRENHEQSQNEVYNEIVNMVKELRTKHIKGIISKVELGMIKHFSQIESNRDIKNGTIRLKQDLSDENFASSGEDGLKLILECVEDLQVDISGAENENDSLIENFLEEMQDVSESIRKAASDKMDDFGCKIEDKISQSRFKFKSLLFALRNMSQTKAQAVLENWTHCLQKALTKIFIRKDLEQYDEQQNTRIETEENKPEVIFWFKDIESITRSEFERTRTSFKDYVDKRYHLCQTLFDQDDDDSEKMTKDVIAEDLEQDFMNNNKTSYFAKEFLICQQFLEMLLHTFNAQQHLSDAEVKECFTTLKKAVQSLTNSGITHEDISSSVTKEDIAGFLGNFQNDCSSQQLQKQSSIVSGIEIMIFDEEGLADKMNKVVIAKKKQKELMEVMIKMQIENLYTLTSLFKLDKISLPEMMKFVKVLYMNLPKKRFDEIMKTIYGSNEQDSLAELIRYQLEDKISETIPKEREMEQETGVKKKKKKKKNNVLRKNTVAPDK